MKKIIIILAILFMLPIISFSQQCVANFFYSTDTSNVYTIHFIDSSSSNINNWHWNFGDGYTSIFQNPTHVYSDTGYYYVSLIALVDTMGSIICSDTFSTYIHIQLPVCNASFQTQTNNCNKCITFNDYSTSTGSIISWSWDFGDGTSGTGQNPYHCYLNNGLYNVCLTINSNYSCIDTFCTNIYVNDSNYIYADFNYYVDTIVSDVFYFIDNSSGNINSWLWNFGDGTTSTQPNPYHIYTNSGTYNVCLITSNSYCSDTICDTIIIGNLNLYNIGGQVFAGSYPINGGSAYLYQIFNNQFFLYDTIYFEVNGYFYFTYVPQGNYIIKVFPDESSQYVPTYYGNKLKWNDATIIYLNDSIYDLDINMQNIVSSGGTGAITGSLLYNQILLPNIEILLTNINGEPVDYMMTNANGGFAFNNLAFGTYIIYAEETGKYNIPISVTIDENNPLISNVEIILYNTGTGNINYSSNFSIGEIFPNPVSNEINLNIDIASASELILTIINTYGQKIKENRITLVKGQHIIKLPANDIPSGFYLLNIVSDSGININKRFIR